MSINLNGIDTSNVTNMQGLFDYCYQLSNLDITGFNTSNVTNMNSMFSKCIPLTSIDLSGFDTSKVTDMGGMFFGLTHLSGLDLSHFDTSNVTNMSSMFNQCYCVKTSYLDHLDTSKVTDMSYMFSGCNFSTFDTGNLNSSNVTNMNYMFSGCHNLTRLDLSRLDMSKVVNVWGMFTHDSNLRTIYVSQNWPTEQFVFNSDKTMFRGCTSLVGGNGTGYDSNHEGKDYARIDGYKTPGYFTQNIKGDVNQDKQFTKDDPILAKKHVMKDSTATVTALGKIAGDLDNNGKITINEVNVRFLAENLCDELSGFFRRKENNRRDYSHRKTL